MSDPAEMLHSPYMWFTPTLQTSIRASCISAIQVTATVAVTHYSDIPLQQQTQISPSFFHSLCMSIPKHAHLFANNSLYSLSDTKWSAVKNSSPITQNILFSKHAPLYRKYVKTCKIIETSQKERFEFVAVCSGMSLQWDVATVDVALLDSLKWKSLLWRLLKWDVTMYVQCLWLQRWLSQLRYSGSRIHYYIKKKKNHRCSRFRHCQVGGCIRKRDSGLTHAGVLAVLVH